MVGRKVAEMDSLIDKVRKGLECHKDEIPGVCGKCPYFTESGFCSGRLAKDALELLKEQEALKPKNKVRHGANAQIQHFCGNCNSMLHGKPKCCPNCGKPILWKGR